MKRLSRSVTVGVALSLMVLVGLTGSTGAAQGQQSFTVGSVAYTYHSFQTTSNSYEDKLEAFNLEWTGLRPDSACTGVWNSDGSGPFVSTCESIKGNQQKYPQNFGMSGLIPSLASGTSYNLRAYLIRHGNVIASSGPCSITGGINSSCSPQ